jgi:hypothetical protein
MTGETKDVAEGLCPTFGYIQIIDSIIFTLSMQSVLGFAIASIMSVAPLPKQSSVGDAIRTAPKPTGGNSCGRGYSPAKQY